MIFITALLANCDEEPQLGLVNMNKQNDRFLGIEVPVFKKLTTTNKQSWLVQL